MKVQELMTKDVLALPESMLVTEAALVLREHRVSGAPVVDPTGRPVGVVSRTDLLEGFELAEADRRWVYYRLGIDALLSVPSEPPAVTFGRRPLKEIMMPMVFSIQRDDTIERAATLMAKENVHRLLVLDGRRLAGIITSTDIVRAVSNGFLRAA